MNVSEADVRAEVERILASRGFVSAGRLSRLLRYIVDKTLANQADQLKEYAVGVEVFDRDEKYDPRLDSIVRVEAGRLRSRLDEYYNGDGAGSPMRITLPRGGYVAKFEPQPPPLANRLASDGETSPERPAAAEAGPRFSWALTAGLIMGVAAMVIWLVGSTPAPAETGAPGVAVLAFSGADQDVALRITEAVTSELARLNTVSVASFTSAMDFAGKRAPLPEIASALNVDYVVEASVERDGAGYLVTARVVDAATDRKVWVADYRGAESELRAISQRLAFEVGAEVLQRAR